MLRIKYCPPYKPCHWIKYYRPPDELIQPSAAQGFFHWMTELMTVSLTTTITHASLPPQNVTRAQFLKGILVLIFPGSGELQKAVLLLECPQEVKLRFSFYAFHVIC